MGMKRILIGKSLARWCTFIALLITFGVVHCGATEPVLGGSDTPASGAAGGATAEATSSRDALNRSAQLQW